MPRPGMVDWLSSILRAHTDRIYAVPGYPITDLASRAGAMLVINEKVALEFAIGDSLAGRRACVIVKHVGMNALVDPLVHASYQGIRGGVVIICGDDPGARNTMTVQDSRTFGPVAAIPVLEPESRAVIRDAFEVSEQYSRVALIRFTADHLYGEGFPDSLSEDGSPDLPLQVQGCLADPDLTMYGRAVRTEAGTVSLCAAGLAPGEYPPVMKTSLPMHRSERGYALSLCAKCPFAGLFHLMKQKGMSAVCDTGCSLIALNPPFSFGVASYGMGSAVAVAATAGIPALIGDYALLHSGLQGLIEVYNRQIPLLCIVMVNRCMGMTGGQPTLDPLPYLSFACPDICESADVSRLEQLLMGTGLPRTILVYGTCPEVIHHETVAC
jgi:indolepyruvate ferredoxin oxidoreductase, alpha subunit